MAIGDSFVPLSQKTNSSLGHWPEPVLVPGASRRECAAWWPQEISVSTKNILSIPLQGVVSMDWACRSEDDIPPPAPSTHLGWWESSLGTNLHSWGKYKTIHQYLSHGIFVYICHFPSIQDLFVHCLAWQSRGVESTNSKHPQRRQWGQHHCRLM